MPVLCPNPGRSKPPVLPLLTPPSPPQEAVEALTRAGLRNPVRVAVAVAGAPQTAAQKVGSRRGGDAAGEAAGDGGQVTPATLQLQYVVCEVDEKLGQLVSVGGRGAPAVGWGAHMGCLGSG
jgi:hypothetical protein